MICPGMLRQTLSLVNSRGADCGPILTTRMDRYLEKIKKRKRHHGISHSGRDVKNTFVPAASRSVAAGHTGMPQYLQPHSEADASRKNKKKDSGQKPASAAEHENARTGAADDVSVKKKKRKLSPADRRKVTCRQRDTESCTDQHGRDRISEKMMPKVDWKNLFCAKKGSADRFGQGGPDSAGRGEPGSREAQTTELCTKRETQKQKKKHNAGTGASAAAGNGSAIEKASSVVAEPGNHSVAEGGDGSFPYDADPSDHAETPDEAYADVAPLLERLAECLGKTKETVRIYDPYYCNGGVIRRLKRHGFLHIYNRREDFYEKIAKKTTPDFDILLTNPPYSGDHPAKIVDFCCSVGKPWLLLVPNWVYIKEYYPWCPVSPAAPQVASCVPHLQCWEWEMGGWRESQSARG